MTDLKRRTEIGDALMRVGASQPCPRCGGNGFDVLGESMVYLQLDPKVVDIAGPAVRTAVIACKTCGYMMHHATPTLGLSEGISMEESTARRTGQPG